MNAGVIQHATGSHILETLHTCGRVHQSSLKGPGFWVLECFGDNKNIMLPGKSTRSSDIQKGIQPVKGEPPKASFLAGGRWIRQPCQYHVGPSITILVGGLVFNHLENISQWEELSHILYKIKPTSIACYTMLHCYS